MCKWLIKEVLWWGILRQWDIGRGGVETDLSAFFPAAWRGVQNQSQVQGVPSQLNQNPGEGHTETIKGPPERGSGWSTDRIHFREETIQRGRLFGLSRSEFEAFRLNDMLYTTFQPPYCCAPTVRWPSPPCLLHGDQMAKLLCGPLSDSSQLIGFLYSQLELDKSNLLWACVLITVDVNVCVSGWKFMKLWTKRNQVMPSPNMLFLLVDYFELKALEKHQIRQGLSAFTLST